MVSGLENRVQERTTELTAANQMLPGWLAAGIAHEINTPIQYVGDNTLVFKITIYTVVFT